MAVADLFFLALVVVSAIISLFRGLMREALSLTAWVLAFVVALRFGQPVSEYLTPYVSVPSVRLATAYAVLFLGTLIIGAVVNFFIGKMVRATGFSGTDRLLGMIFGVARGLAIIIIAIMLARLTVVREDPWWKESFFIEYLEPWAIELQAMLPENVTQQIGNVQLDQSNSGTENESQKATSTSR